jgi:hypothetical protein
MDRGLLCDSRQAAPTEIGVCSRHLVRRALRLPVTRQPGERNRPVAGQDDRAHLQVELGVLERLAHPLLEHERMSVVARHVGVRRFVELEELPLLRAYLGEADDAEAFGHARRGRRGCTEIEGPGALAARFREATSLGEGDGLGLVLTDKCLDPLGADSEDVALR